MVTAAIGLTVTIFSFFLNPKLERDGLEDNQSNGLWPDIVRNSSEIKQALLVPEFYRVICFILIGGVI